MSVDAPEASGATLPWRHSRARLRRCQRCLRDRGSVALEIALVMPVVIAVVALGLSAVSAAGAQSAVHAAALAVAREAALGAPAEASAAARRVAGHDATVTVERAAGWVEATVTAPAAWPWPAARAVAWLPEEP